MTILLTGGGSGGHITPILAVAAELKRLRPDVKLYYVGQTGDTLSDIPAASPFIDKVYSVRAGKFRRYHGEGIKQLFDVPTMLKNARDVVYVLIGIVQSLRLMAMLKPDVLFTRGGFVSVPVGLAAGWRGVPYVTHDSDSTPSLANRIIAKKAAMHAVALPKEVYMHYPPDRTVTVGIPLGSDFRPVGTAQKAGFRHELGIAAEAPVLFVTGGGNGAQRLNIAVADALPAMLATLPGLVVVHLVGRANMQSMTEYYAAKKLTMSGTQLILKDFVTDLYRYSAAADVVITRAGATNLAEFALQHKACIVVPNPQLTGGHQNKNAQALADKNAVVLVEEDALKADATLLSRTAAGLLKDASRQTALGTALASFAYPDAAKRLAVVLLEEAEKHKPIRNSDVSIQTNSSK